MLGFLHRENDVFQKTFCILILKRLPSRTAHTANVSGNATATEFHLFKLGKMIKKA
jgi:hypothetical protein